MVRTLQQALCMKRAPTQNREQTLGQSQPGAGLGIFNHQGHEGPQWKRSTRFDNLPCRHVLSNFRPSDSSKHGCPNILFEFSALFGGPMKFRRLKLAALFLLLAAMAAAQDIGSFEERVT